LFTSEIKAKLRECEEERKMGINVIPKNVSSEKTLTKFHKNYVMF